MLNSFVLETFVKLLLCALGLNERLANTLEDMFSCVFQEFKVCETGKDDNISRLI